MVQLRSIDTLNDIEKLSLIDMSYSRLDTYNMCPAKYFYTYILQEDRVFGPAAALGNVLHAVLEDSVGEPLVYDKMLECMEEHRETYDPDHLIDQTLINDGRVMLGEFVDRHVEEEFDIIGKELKFEILIGSALVLGYIDLVARGPSGLIKVCDYKSGKYEVSNKNIATDLQLGIYALASSQMFPDQPIYAELYYLRSGRRKGHLFQQEDLQEVYERTIDQINTIIEDRNFRYTEASWPCSFCDHRKSGVCAVGVKRRGRN